MLMLRLQRIGRRNEPHYKIVVIEKTKGPKSQKYIDVVGTYNPKAGTVTIDEAKAASWLEKGVQPSDTVYNMLVTKGLVEGRKKNVLPKKSPVIDHEKIAKEKEEAEAKAAKAAEEKAAAEEAAKAETEAPSEEVAEEITKTEETVPEAEAPAEAEVTEEVVEETKTEE